MRNIIATGVLILSTAGAALSAAMPSLTTTQPDSVILENDTDSPWTAIIMRPYPPILDDQWHQVDMEVEAVLRGDKIAISFDGGFCQYDIVVFYFSGANLKVSVNICQSEVYQITGALE